MSKLSYLPGSWENILASDLQNEKKPLKDRFDIIIMCEVLYNKEYYTSLTDLIHYCLKKNPDSCVLIGTKTYYYGLGSGFYDYQQFIQENKQKWVTDHGTLQLDTVEKLNDMKSIERLIVKMTYGKPREVAGADEKMEGDDGDDGGFSL